MKLVTWLVGAIALGYVERRLCFTRRDRQGRRHRGEGTNRRRDRREAFHRAPHGADARKLYLHPVLTATGRRVTRAFPMEQVAGESTDHAHQRGVWIGAERLSGVDFWENEPSYDRPSIGAVVLKDVADVRSGTDDGRLHDPRGLDRARTTSRGSPKRGR